MSTLEEYDTARDQTDPGETNNLYGKPEIASLQEQLLSRLDHLQQQVPQRAAAAHAAQG